MRLNCIDCGTHGDCGGRGVFCHTHLNLSHSQRPGQTKLQEKGPSSATVGRHSAASLKNNRKHMWRFLIQEGTAGLQSSQEPGSQDWDPAWPCRFPLTLPYPLHWGKGRGRATSSRYRCWAQPQEAAWAQSEGWKEWEERMMDVFVLSRSRAFCGVVMLT